MLQNDLNHGRVDLFFLLLAGEGHLAPCCIFTNRSFQCMLVFCVLPLGSSVHPSAGCSSTIVATGLPYILPAASPPRCAPILLLSLAGSVLVAA